MTLDWWKKAGSYFDFDGRRIFYRDQGRGQPILYIHGFPTASYDWHSVWQPLLLGHRSVAPDMLGFGFSDKPARHTYSILEQATILEALLAHLSLDRCHVLAHDYGDTVAQELLARHDERGESGRPGLKILSVCLLNGGLFPETHRARVIQKLLAKPVLGALIARMTDRKRFERSFRGVFGKLTQPSSAEMDDFWTLVTYNDGHLRSHRLIGYIAERKLYRERWVGALRKTDVPIRVINGPADPVSGRHMIERYRELIPNPDIVELAEHIGHYPQLEDPEGVLVAYLSFLERIKKADRERLQSSGEAPRRRESP